MNALIPKLFLDSLFALEIIENVVTFGCFELVELYDLFLYILQ